MKKAKKENIKSINLALYFGLLVLLIIIISISFKTIDIIRKSEFDSKNRFTVAVLNGKNLDLISVDPSIGQQTGIRVENAKSLDSIDEFSIPVDVFVESDSDFSSESKSVFLKMLLNKRELKSSLNVLDLLKLSIYSFGVDGEKFSYQNIRFGDEAKLNSLSSSEFIDETISQDKVNIQVTNSTEVGGLGNKIAKTITNLGGNVVLVNSSKDKVGDSVIYYKEKTYTVEKLSKVLDIKIEKNETNSIADIIIVLGEDQEE